MGKVTRHVLGLLAATVLMGVGGARAAETEWWISDSAADLAKSEARGIIVDPEGVMSLGPALKSWSSDSLGVIWAVAPLADGSIAVAGDRGRIDRWTERDGFRPWVRLPVGQVFTLATAGDGVVAGTGPNGAVYRIGPRGDTTLVARTGERYVWGLVPAAGGAWYAATGTRGKLLRVANGETRVILDSDESNLISIVSDGKGGCYAGGDSKGRIFHARADGSLSTVFDASEDEIRALALARDGSLFAAGLSGSAVESTGGGEDDRPAPARSAVASARATVYRIVPDSIAVAWWTAAQPMVFALVSTAEGMVAATGNRAGVYRLDRPGGATQLALFPQGQITALAVDRRGALYAASSNPGTIWKVGPERAARGELLSAVHDARRLAEFGRIRWSGVPAQASVRLETRSGNSDPPDTTWSRWSGRSVGAEGGDTSSPPGRYLQWKLVLESAAERVATVEAAWRERNLPPRIEELTVAPQGIGFREGELTPRMESVTQTLPGGQKVEYSMPSASGPRGLRELPMWAVGLRTLQWRGSDPNGDPLRYRVDVRAEGGRDWIAVGEELANATFTWDTRGLPDGRYRVRITASDHAGNALGEESTTSVTSASFIVDNTPPRISRFESAGESGGVRFAGEAEDGENVLTRLEVALDDDVWRHVSPLGGMADEKTLAFRGRWPDVKPGEHTLSVRAVDAGGNSVVRAVRVTVPTGR
ncbi:MAG: hypothetical protein ABIR22_00900 [Candidatus Eisenbacteria bacterium]